MHLYANITDAVAINEIIHVILNDAFMSIVLFILLFHLVTR